MDFRQRRAPRTGDCRFSNNVLKTINDSNAGCADTDDGRQDTGNATLYAAGKGSENNPGKVEYEAAKTATAKNQSAALGHASCESVVKT